MGCMPLLSVMHSGAFLLSHDTLRVLLMSTKSMFCWREWFLAVFYVNCVDLDL